MNRIVCNVTAVLMFSVLYPKFNTDPGSRIRIPYIKPATFLDLSFLNKFETDFCSQIPPQLSVLYPKFNTEPVSQTGYVPGSELP